MLTGVLETKLRIRGTQRLTFGGILIADVVWLLAEGLVGDQPARLQDTTQLTASVKQADVRTCRPRCGATQGEPNCGVSLLKIPMPLGEQVGPPEGPPWQCQSQVAGAGSNWTYCHTT